MGEAGSQAFIAATVLLMVATPFLTSVGSRIAKKIEKRQTIVDAETMVPEPLPEAHAARLQNHVIVAGYGNAARQLVRVLHGSQVPYVITTLNPGGAEEAESEGLPVIRGDASKQLTLQHAGIQRAKMVVIPDDDPATAHRIAAIARQSSEPGTRIVVRTRYLAEIEPLTKAGVDRVVAEELESIVQLFAEVLRNYEVAPEEIERHEATIRRGGYAALRDEGVPETPVVVCNIPGGCAPDGTPRATPAVEERAMRRTHRHPAESDARDPRLQGGVRSSRSDPAGLPERGRLRGLPAHRRLVGPPAHLHDLRSHGLLRFVAEPACHEAPSSDRPSDRPIDGAGRRLGLVLRRRGGRVMALRDGSTSVEELRGLHHPQQGRVFADLPHDFLAWLISVGHVREGDDGDVFVEPNSRRPTRCPSS